MTAAGRAAFAAVLCLTLVGSAFSAGAHQDARGTNQQYAALVEQYRSGQPDAVVERLVADEPDQWLAIAGRVVKMGSTFLAGGAMASQFYEAASLMHAQAAFRLWTSGVGKSASAHFDGALALVDRSDHLAGKSPAFTRHSIDGRAVLLIFSDGSDTSSWLDPRSVITAAQRSDVVVYGVTLQRQTEQRNVREARQNRLERGWFQEAPTAFGRHFLPLLTEETGGSVLVAERSDQLRDTFLRVIRDFKSRYILSYTPRGVEDGGWHAITVRLKGGRRGEITARRGYLRGPS